MTDPEPSVSRGPDATPEVDSAVSWRRTEELFHRAMDSAPEVRAARVAAWCGADLALRASVLALIEADSFVEDLISSAPQPDPGEFLKREPAAEPREDDKDESNGEGNEDHWIGRVLGAFRLEQLLGRGGMGVVYRGERISGGFSQTVAVKLVGRHLRSSPAVDQFLLERETLARLEHANIARLLDGGVTSEGFPYVVMEHIRGRRLDAASDDPRTTVTQIIGWMSQLCEAVAYVHRNLILHRDLKPGNVMVTEDGQVKLLDFGTLKRIGPGGDTDQGMDSAMTRAGMRPVTVRYASPEHIRGIGVSTAADVYSLGMILFRLIAGRLPEELEDLPIGLYLERLKAGGFRPPSQIAVDNGVARQMDATMARDLDAIVAKAIRYEASARYPTPRALAEDLWSVLLHRPVSARAGNLRYIAEKYYRRNRWPIRTAAAAVLVLAVGLSAMAWQGHLARLQEIRAERGVEDERQLAHMLLFDYFEQLSLIPGSIEAQKKAVTQALAYLDGLAQIAPGSNLELETIGGFTDMGNLLGNPYKQNLGDVPGAILSLNKAIELAKARAAKNPRDLPSLQALVEAEIALGGTYLGIGDVVHAEPILKTGTDAAAEIARSPAVTGSMLQMAASVSDLLGDVYDPGRGYATADMNKAVDAYLLSNVYDEKCHQHDLSNDLCRSGVVVGEYKLGSLIEDTDPASAAMHYQHGLEVVRQFSVDLMKTTRSHRLKNYMLSRLGLMEMRTGRMTEATALIHEAQQGFRDAIAKAELDNRARFDLVAFETDLAVEYDRFGMEQDAAATAREVLGILEVLLKRSPGNIRWQMIQAQNWMTCGRVESKLGHMSAGADATRRGLAEAIALAQAKDASPEALGLAADGLIQSRWKIADAHLALEFAERAVSTFAKPMPAQLLTLAKAQAAAGEEQQARKTAQAVLGALAGPVKSGIVAGQIAEARRLIRD